MGVIVKALSNSKPQMSQNFIGAPSFRYKNPALYNFYCDDRYASIFPSVKAIANEFMTIRPYTVNNEKESVPSPVRDALYHPNQLDSSVAFFEKLAVMNLTHRNTYVLVWRRERNEAQPGGTITPQNIAGFTFLENPAIEVRDKRTYYKMGTQEFSDMEVITIPGGVDPSGLYNGYAPGIASAQWATLDDFIADYQKGFFKNGAIPSGLFTVVAPTTQEYNDIVDEIEKRHSGAGNNNKPTFAHSPIGADGKPAQAQITWTPMQQSNKDIDFHSLFEQANKRIDSAFGVPASIRGVGENNNYATAKTDQQNFIRFTVKPLALRIYTQITHELNRITGGLGVAITFKLELPAIAEEEKVVEETKQIRDNRVIALEARGYTLESIKRYFDTGDIESLVKVVEPASEDDDVDDGDEVIDSPDPTKIDGVTPLNKAKKEKKQPKAELTDEQKIEAATRQYMQSQVDRVAAEYADTQDAVEPEPKTDELDEYVAAMFAIVLGILLAYGEEEYAAGVALSNLNVDDLQGFTLSTTAQDSYQAYLRRVGSSYGEDTAKSIRKVLADSDEFGWTRSETEKALKNIMNTDDWRVRRLAVTELNRSQAQGSLEGMKSLAAEVNVEYEKALDHSGSSTVPCEFCQTYEGKWFPLDEPILGLGEAVVGVEGTIFVNDFIELQSGDIHPNGRGAMIFREVKA